MKINKEKVFCKNCKHWSFFGCHANYNIRIDPIYGERKEFQDKRKINKNFDCPKFEKFVPKENKVKKKSLIERIFSSIAPGGIVSANQNACVDNDD